jgi:uncharacterized membrane protein YoaK (UPF0700 family)
MPQLRHRGIVAIVIAITLAVVLIIVVGAVASGVEVSEFGRDAAWAIVGALAGALVTFVTATSGNNGTPPPSPPK